MMAREEAARLAALRNLSILDTAPSESFDRITRMASQIFGLPIAAVSLTDADRQWFKSRVGVEHWEIPRERAPCGEVADLTNTVIIRDFKESECYRDSFLGVSGVRFYAGAPLVTRDGYGLGALCVLGTEPREVSEQEIKSLEDLAAMVMAQIELQHAFGRIDPASGLPNRNQFIDDLDDMARDRSGQSACVVVIDLMGGTEFSDVMRVVGPVFIDELVVSASRVMRQVLGNASRLYQTGVTQFAYITASAEESLVLDEAILLRASLIDTSRRADAPITTVPSLGITPFVLGPTVPRDVLRRAHGAAYDARNSDIGIGVYNSSLDEAHSRRFTLLKDIRTALRSQDQLWLAYQPRIDLRSGVCAGVEALLRWNHPDLGSVSPAEFMPLVEKSALARDVTEWVLQKAIAQAVAWRAEGLNLLMAVNISGVNLDEEDFAERLIARVSAAGLPFSAIEIELTESAVPENGKAALAQLERINAAGITIAIDDFGTGYSSLSYLERIPAHVVKIDRSFMAALGGDVPAGTLVSAMISLAHDLGYRVVAEGIETEEVYAFLADKGCDEAQGFLMSRPLAPGDLMVWLDSRGEGARYASDERSSIPKRA
jgi:EAL domain-containing protein (putative c-di-GMP-specific phosphodiesterase class I)/GGDEF domain-containing protein